MGQRLTTQYRFSLVLGNSPMERLTRSCIASRRRRSAPEKTRDSLLTVIGAGAVFAVEVFVEQLWLNRRKRRIQLQRHQRHVGAAFQRDRNFNGFCDRPAPGKRCVTVDEHAAKIRRVERCGSESLDDDVACLPFVATRDLMANAKWSTAIR